MQIISTSTQNRFFVGNDQKVLIFLNGLYEDLALLFQPRNFAVLKTFSNPKTKTEAERAHEMSCTSVYYDN